LDAILVGSATLVCCPERLVFAGSKLPRAAKGIAVAHEPHRAMVEAIEKRQRTRAESLASCRAATSKPLSTIGSVASSVPGAPRVKLAGAV
jgi:hypothetical protein